MPIAENRKKERGGKLLAQIAVRIRTATWSNLLMRMLPKIEGSALGKGGGEKCCRRDQRSRGAKKIRPVQTCDVCRDRYYLMGKKEGGHKGSVFISHWQGGCCTRGFSGAHDFRGEKQDQSTWARLGRKSTRRGSARNMT